MNSVPQTPDDVLTSWFHEITPKQWWATSNDLDKEIESRFGDLHYAARRSELYGWRESAKGRLAEQIVLDQFSRNIYRNHPNAFAYDSLALALAQTAITGNADHKLDINQRAFFYMPYMHSESLMIHEVFCQLGMEANLQFELRHKEIIYRFGRYPHRNVILGSTSTPEEIDFLKNAGLSF
jgi:uncharacterized protein (DUF924 family)